MKKIILLAALIAAITTTAATAQTVIYDSVLQSAYVPVNPVQARYSDTVLATRLYLVSASDNLSNQCELRYTLRDNKRHTLLGGKLAMSGADYTAWNGSNAAAFTYVAGKLGLTIAPAPVSSPTKTQPLNTILKPAPPKH